jgi:dihydrofolate synthase/folylpolyglutamate synthase
LNRSGELTRPPLTTLQDWLRWLEVLHPQKIDLSLERICAVLEALGLASPPFRIASVAGTNGKGSCVATLEAVFLGQGYRVGAYTSPHLWRFNERVRVDGAEVSDAELMAVFEHIDRVRGETTLSYFEYTTAAACVCFAERAVDLAVLEVGLGGRLDAVNAMDADLALITSIDLDHQHWLGDTRDAIGVEKAGIMRPGRPAIVADRDPPLPLLAYAKRGGVPLRRLGADFDFLRHDDGSWDFRGGEWRLEGLPKPALRGAVQYENAAACLAAAEALAEWLPIEPARLGASRWRGACRASGATASNGYSTSRTTRKPRPCSPASCAPSARRGARWRSSASWPTRTSAACSSR